MPDGSNKLLRDLFEENPVDVLTAFRINKWNIPEVNFISFSIQFQMIDYFRMVKN
jgi:hypothetical protein